MNWFEYLLKRAKTNSEVKERGGSYGRIALRDRLVEMMKIPRSEKKKFAVRICSAAVNCDLVRAKDLRV